MTENESGQAGIGNTANLHFTPTPVPINESISRVAVGNESIFAVGQDGKRGPGPHRVGSLALGEQRDYPVPLRIAGLPADVVEVAAGLRASTARTQSGAVWAWCHVALRGGP